MNQQDDDIYTLIQGNQFFSGLSDAQLKRVLSLSQEVRLKKDECIIREGDSPDKFYIIIKGKVATSKMGLDESTIYRLGTLREGDIIGEIGLVTQKERTASIFALTDVTMLAFPIKAFHLQENSDLLSSLMKNISEILVNRLEESYDLVVGSMHNELKKSKKLRLYQFILIIIMAFFLIQLGLSIRYIWSKSGVCQDVYKSTQVPQSVPKMGP